jgi:hypothetical protein
MANEGLGYRWRASLSGLYFAAWGGQKTVLLKPTSSRGGRQSLDIRWIFGRNSVSSAFFENDEHRVNRRVNRR